ncbi:MAG: DUF2520 domain-containing protein [Candidatus Aminicenantes bacterium]|nr:DUF2520 domain-containing protein [Candidatus Aminicenantes bacterium]
MAVLGAGRVGTSLGAALRRAGWNVASVACRRSASARESARLIGGGAAPFTDIRAAAERGDVVFLCLPDREIAGAARRLGASSARWDGKAVFHTGGALPASALAPLRKRGAAVASFHPVRSFPVKDASGRLFAGVSVALEGDPKAAAVGARIVKALGGRTLRLRPEQKEAFHAACAVVSNYLVVLLDTAEATLVRAGIKDRNAVRALRDLAQGTLRNVNSVDTRRALTGPIVRGDAETVGRHLRALRGSPRHREVYVALGRAALDLAERRGLPADRVRALRSRLGERRPLPRARRRTSS